MEKFNQNTENISQENTPLEIPEEFIIKVLDKVVDIDSPGTAFTFIGRLDQETEAKLVSIFENGIMGTFREQEGMNRSGFGNKIDRETYVKHLKEGDRGEVYFNIVDRLYPVHLSPKIKDSGYDRYPENDIFLVFDLDHFKEVEWKDEDYKKLKRDPYMSQGTFSLGLLKHRTYVIQEGRSAQEFEKNEKGETVAGKDMGFILSPRVAPRELRGVVFSMNQPMSQKEHTGLINKKVRQARKESTSFEYERDKNFWDKQIPPVKEEVRPELLRERAKHIAELMLQSDKDKPELLIPIYDQHGNMWWPKEMLHEEIVKNNKEKAARDASSAYAKI